MIQIRIGKFLENGAKAAVVFISTIKFLHMSTNALLQNSFPLSQRVCSGLPNGATQILKKLDTMLSCVLSGIIAAAENLVSRSIQCSMILPFSKNFRSKATVWLNLSAKGRQVLGLGASRRCFLHKSQFSLS